MYKLGQFSLGQWTSKSIRNKHSLHPTFMHGSTLGLYEVLTGKPYLCNMITESVAMCFFLETDNILSLLQSDPAIEDFLWQVLTVHFDMLDYIRPVHAMILL